MTPEQMDKLRTLLIRACDKHLERGDTIISGQFENGPTHCCPIGYLVGYRSSDMMVEISELLGEHIDEREIWEFIFAFDGKRKYSTFDRDPMVQLGRELRAKYIKE